jgi:hypothetical protein
MSPLVVVKAENGTRRLQPVDNSYITFVFKPFVPTFVAECNGGGNAHQKIKEAIACRRFDIVKIRGP